MMLLELEDKATLDKSSPAVGLRSSPEALALQVKESGSVLKGQRVLLAPDTSTMAAW